MTMEFLWNSSSGTRILVQYNNFDDYQILQELDDHGILVKFQRDFDKNSFQDWNDHGVIQVFCSELFSRIRWPQNSYEIFWRFQSEFWWPENSLEIFQGFWSDIF